MSLLAPCLPYVDLFCPSIEEAKMITGQQDPSQIAAVLHDKGVKVVALKMGEKGSYLSLAATTLQPVRLLISFFVVVPFCIYLDLNLY
jgi:sugar/nucleoside kinase (ribokinase family)